MKYTAGIEIQFMNRKILWREESRNESRTNNLWSLTPGQSLKGWKQSSFWVTKPRLPATQSRKNVNIKASLEHREGFFSLEFFVFEITVSTQLFSSSC